MLLLQFQKVFYNYVLDFFLVLMFFLEFLFRIHCIMGYALGWNTSSLYSSLYSTLIFNMDFNSSTEMLIFLYYTLISSNSRHIPGPFLYSAFSHAQFYFSLMSYYFICFLIEFMLSGNF